MEIRGERGRVVRTTAFREAVGVSGREVEQTANEPRGCGHSLTTFRRRLACRLRCPCYPSASVLGDVSTCAGDVCQVSGTPESTRWNTEWVSKPGRLSHPTT